MKKSELRQIIREELLRENRTFAGLPVDSRHSRLNDKSMQRPAKTKELKINSGYRYAIAMEKEGQTRGVARKWFEDMKYIGRKDGDYVFADGNYVSPNRTPNIPYYRITKTEMKIILKNDWLYRFR